MPEITRRGFIAAALAGVAGCGTRNSAERRRIVSPILPENQEMIDKYGVEIVETPRDGTRPEVNMHIAANAAGQAIDKITLYPESLHIDYKDRPPEDLPCNNYALVRLHVLDPSRSSLQLAVVNPPGEEDFTKFTGVLITREGAKFNSKPLEVHADISQAQRINGVFIANEGLSRHRSEYSVDLHVHGLNAAQQDIVREAALTASARTTPCHSLMLNSVEIRTNGNNRTFMHCGDEIVANVVGNPSNERVSSRPVAVR